MWCAFDNKGILIRTLEHGMPPRQGVSQTFDIFAYFQDIDLEEYNTATIIFTRPDNSRTIEYFMDLVSLTDDREPPLFIKLDSELGTSPFVNGQKYAGYKYVVEDSALLSMEGTYKATIRLYNSGGIMVEGLVKFYVQPSVYTGTYDISQSQFKEIMNDISNLRSSKQNQLIVNDPQPGALQLTSLTIDGVPYNIAADSSSLVTLNTTQIITGQKTFQNSTYFDHPLYSTHTDYGETNIRRDLALNAGHLDLSVSFGVNNNQSYVEQYPKLSLGMILNDGNYVPAFTITTFDRIPRYKKLYLPINKEGTIALVEDTIPSVGYSMSKTVSNNTMYVETDSAVEEIEDGKILKVMFYFIDYSGTRHWYVLNLCYSSTLGINGVYDFTNIRIPMYDSNNDRSIFYDARIAVVGANKKVRVSFVLNSASDAEATIINSPKIYVLE